MQLRPVLLALALSTAVSHRTAHPPARRPYALDIQGTLMNLADQPATHTGFVFDRSMMQIAQGLLESGGLDANRAAAAITSISVDNYRYPAARLLHP